MPQPFDLPCAFDDAVSSMWYVGSLVRVIYDERKISFWYIQVSAYSGVAEGVRWVRMHRPPDKICPYFRESKRKTN